MTGVKQLDPLQPGLDAVRHHRDAADIADNAPRPTFAISPAALPIASTIDALRQSRQMRRQHPCRMAGRDPGVEQLDEMVAHRALSVGPARG